MEWRPIETAPKDGSMILVCQSSNNIISSASWSYIYNHWATYPGPMGFITEVTHWMPLPQPPKENKE